MSTYHYIGCEKCEEKVAFLSDGMAGLRLMGGVADDAPAFCEKHIRNGHEDHLRVFSEHDPRDHYANFDPNKPWDVAP